MTKRNRVSPLNAAIQIHQSCKLFQKKVQSFLYEFHFSFLLFSEREIFYFVTRKQNCSGIFKNILFFNTELFVIVLTETSMRCKMLRRGFWQDSISITIRIVYSSPLPRSHVSVPTQPSKSSLNTYGSFSFLSVSLSRQLSLSLFLTIVMPTRWTCTAYSLSLFCF